MEAATAVGTSVALTIAVVQLIKQVDVKNTLSRFYPIFSAVIGVGFGFYFGLSFVTSLTIGLAAAGTYDLGKGVIGK